MSRARLMHVDTEINEYFEAINSSFAMQQQLHSASHSYSN